MSNRAHHPAERASEELSDGEWRATGSGESEPAGEASAPARERAGRELEAAREAADVADDDDDAEEVVPEPDSDALGAAPERSSSSLAPLPIVSIEAAPAPKAAPAAAQVPAAEGASEGSGRRTSRPPPLGAELTAEELAASAAEMTADELELDAGASSGEAPARAEAEPPRAGFEPPWVDEVPDPVTPYEQRVSETVKVADLPPVELARGRVLANRYLAEEVAEHSACSISYRAYHLALDRAVTVRILLRGLACSDEVCQDVRRVAAAASALNHACVAATLDFGILNEGWPFMVTESFQGRTLASILASEGKFVLRRVLHVGKQLAQGLSAAHEGGLVHGLLSPDNVLVVEPGSSAEVAKILGFGVAHARGPVPAPPRSGVFGVPFYVSPEQAACRPLDARSDVYSLGVILYELMTGAPPFSDGDFAAVLCQHLDDDAPSPSSKLPSPGALAKALDVIIERCLRKEPEQRYQTAAELAEDLVRLEAAAARSKRRPMPEVQKPMTTIHTPHRKVEVADAPEAKVIVHEDLDESASPEAPEVNAGRRSSPSLVPNGKAVAPGAPTAARAAAPRPEQPLSRTPGRVRVDQATIKLSPGDRERFVVERLEPPGPSGPIGWIKGGVAALRRFFVPPSRNDGSR